MEQGQLIIRILQKAKKTNYTNWSKFVPGLFIVFDLLAEGVRTGDLLIVDAEDLFKKPHQRFTLKDSKVKENEIQLGNSQHVFLCANGSLRLAERPDHSHHPAASNVD